ncbi:hypothetical protein ZYGM_000837 [Zygosaccharomyces mellis]|uniref:C2H2-type domain-containing protein n=1 Tax=Zygosaccharomyces mellis TaxID=42258 RepID=A0A4C2EAZ4_9SACH|nr:hypothetical protein ZYGM_000837 [Zygosaccharomyces mellis]
MLAQGRKYRTLLPSLTDSLAIEENLKCKLNRFAFDEVGRKPTGMVPGVTLSNRPASLAPLVPPLLTPPYTQIDTTSSQGSTSGSESLGSSPVPHRIKKRRNTNSSSGGERRHVCRVCYKGFTTSGHLARHNRIHTGEKNHQCPYEGCDQRFSRHDNCIQHYRTHVKRELKVSEALRAENGNTSSTSSGVGTI